MKRKYDTFSFWVRIESSDISDKPFISYEIKAREGEGKELDEIKDIFLREFVRLKNRCEE